MLGQNEQAQGESIKSLVGRLKKNSPSGELEALLAPEPTLEVYKDGGSGISVIHLNLTVKTELSTVGKIVHDMLANKRHREIAKTK